MQLQRRASSCPQGLRREMVQHQGQQDVRRVQTGSKEPSCHSPTYPELSSSKYCGKEATAGGFRWLQASYLLPSFSWQFWVFYSKHINKITSSVTCVLDFNRVWQEVPVLVIVSMLAYFCFLEQLLVRPIC